MLQDGHLKMLGGYPEFFMSRDLASTYLNLKNELENLIHHKVLLYFECIILDE
jgi:ATP-dependent RNA helicase DHX36